MPLQEILLRALCARNFHPEIQHLQETGPGIYAVIESLISYVGSAKEVGERIEGLD